MKKFRFPLERVRQFRKLQLESEQARLESCYARLRSLDQMEQELERQRREAEQELLAPGAGLRGQELEGFSAFRDYTRRVRDMLRTRRAEAHTEILAQRERLLEARRKHEMLCRLRDRKQAAWQLEFQREQENLAAELYLTKWAR